MVHDEHEQQFPKVTPGPVPEGGRMRLNPRSERDPVPASSIPPALALFGLGMNSSVAHLSQDQLIATLHHEVWSMRIAAIRRLELLKEQMPVSELLTALHDTHQAVRAAAVRALGQSGERAPIAALMLTLQDSSWQVRAATIHVLGKQQGHVPIRYFVTALRDGEETVRIAALAALGKYGDRAPVESIALALHDPAWMVREAAALALGSLGKRAPLDVLLTALADEDNTVRTAVQQALDQTHPEYAQMREANPGSVPASSTLLTQATHPFATEELELQVFALQPEVVETIQPPASISPLQRLRQVASLLSTIQTRIFTAAATRTRLTWEKIAFRAAIVVAALLFLLSTALLRSQATVSPASAPTVATFFQQMKNPGALGMTRVTWSPASSSSVSPSIAYMDDSGLVHVWNTVTGQYVSSYGPFPTGLAINWLPTGLSIASVRSDGAVQLTSEGTSEQTLMPALGLLGANPLSSWSPDGSRFAIALNSTGNSTIQICGATLASHCAISFARMAGPVTAIAWSSDGKEIATASENGSTTTLAMLDADSGKPVSPSVTLTHIQLVALAWSPDNLHLAYLLADSSVHIIGDGAPMLLASDTTTNNKANSASWRGALAWSPDGRLLAATTSSGAIQVWNTSTNTLLTTYQGHATQISTLIWSHDGKHLASVDINGKVLIWNTNEQQSNSLPNCANVCDTNSPLSRRRTRFTFKDQPTIASISSARTGSMTMPVTKSASRQPG